MNPDFFTLVALYCCCERVIAHDIISRRRAQNVGERIFTGAELCNEIEVVVPVRVLTCPNKCSSQNRVLFSLQQHTTHYFQLHRG